MIRPDRPGASVFKDGGQVAQSVEQRTENPCVECSIHSLPTNQLARHEQLTTVSTFSLFRFAFAGVKRRGSGPGRADARRLHVAGSTAGDGGASGDAATADR